MLTAKSEFLRIKREMYVLKHRTVPPVDMTLSLSESDSHRNGVYEYYPTVDSQFSNCHYGTFLFDYDHERGTKLRRNDAANAEEENPHPHYINIHFPESFNSLWFLVNTH